MAGAGYKLFSTGDVLSASDVNLYLQQQTVMVFASAAARTTALASVLAEGMVTYLKDTDVVEIYTGASWVSLDDPNAIQNSLLTAKGSIVTATGASTPSALAVGTANQVLTVDSSTATGLKWATPSSTPTFVGCALYMDVNQSLTNNTVTNLNWGAEEFDTDAFHSTSSNTSRITIPSGKAGKYLFAWGISYLANATGIRETALRKNGTSISYQDFPVSSNASETNMTATYIANAAVGDYFELAGYQNTGGALDVRSGSIRTFFHCTYLGA